MTQISSLRPLLAPQSIAIIGASDDPARIGGRPVRYLLSAGFEGNIYPVNPNRDVVQGLRSYPDVGAIGTPVDCAIVSVPAERALEAVRECAESGVRSAIVFSAGFSEIGEEGRARQEEMTAIARSSGMRVLGPNTVGVVNMGLKSYQTFSMATEQASARVGRVGMVTQSGGYGSYFLHLSQKQGLSLGQWVATGNESDVEIGEVLQYFADDPGIDVLMGYVEGIRSRETFVRALETAQRNRKPVVMLKVGSSAAGVQAAASHTAALAGSDNIYEAVFRQYGVHRARSPEEFLDVAYAASHGKLPKDRSIAVLTTSGGMGVHAADLFDEAGMELRPVSQSVQAEIMKLTPNGAAANPIDTTGQFVNDPQLLNAILRLLLVDDGFDSTITLLAHAAVSGEFAPRLLAALAPLARDFPDKLLVLAMAAPAEVLGQFREAGFLVFEDLGRATTAIRALARFGELFARSDDIDTSRPEQRLADVTEGMNEVAVKKLFAGIGIASPPERVAQTADEAAKAASELGFPVVLKILSPDIAHKSDVGGVVVGLPDKAAVAKAATAMVDTVSVKAGNARIEGFLVSRMVAGGTECIVGTVTDPIFGPVAMFGLGGISVEVFGDVTFRLAPVSKAEARRMIGEIKGWPLLREHRGRPAADVDALAEAIVSLSRLAAAQPGKIRSMEINPLLAMQDGEGAYALDAAIEIETL